MNYIIDPWGFMLEKDPPNGGFFTYRDNRNCVPAIFSSAPAGLTGSSRPASLPDLRLATLLIAPPKKFSRPEVTRNLIDFSQSLNK
jgi:hypothetical protein